jgi:acetyl esterase/lipase
MNARPYPRDYAKRVSHEDTQLAGIETRRFIPPQKKASGVLFYLHGGSYFFGSARSTHCELMARLAFDTGHEVVGPDVRFSPEHRYPAQLDDALAAYEALLRAGTPASEIILCGDSSGGNLALALALRLRDRGRDLPRALVLISPWVDLEMPGASFQTNLRYDFGRRQELVRHANAFAGILPLSDPRLSPTHADLRGLCPSLVVLGELEIPHDDIMSFAGKLKVAGVDTQVHVAATMPHAPPAMAALHPEGARAVRAIVDYVAEKLG